MAIVPDLLRQAAAIPVRDERICLVTSRTGKRWVIPKGCMEPGKTAGEVGLQEAWEEAGLLDLLTHEPIGSYVYEKDGLLCYVVVFLLTVTEEVDDYPEAGLRQRLWMSLSDALVRVEDAGLRQLLRGVLVSRAAG